MERIDLGTLDALAAAEALSRRPGLAFLDSTGEHGDLGRHSFLACEAFARLTVRGGTAFLDETPLPGPPLLRLREILERYRLDAQDGFPFAGGAIGMVAYDFARTLERLDAPPGPPALPFDLSFGLYDVVLAFDRREGRAVLFSSGLPEPQGPARAERAKRRADEVLAALARPPAAEAQGSPRRCGPWRSSFTRPGFEAAVERVRDYIRAGDIYQANIAQAFTAALPEGFDAWGFHKTLRAVNPAPFGAFLRLGDVALASSSPERFLRMAGGAVETRPIKGTAARAPDPAEDERRAAALLASEKDRAENVMIVDLLRNDLSRVAEPGSVAVPALCRLESYASVHHLTSVVTARLRDGLGPTDLLAAAFPGGSITGAPKIRAMDIVTELEGEPRGAYCGAIGYFGFDGAMDLSIAIRTVTFSPGLARFSAGGGITLLSDPAAEYEETLAKAGGIFAAFEAFAAGNAP